MQTQLQRVLDSESFRHCENLRRLLSYLGERSLSELTDDLKEYTIGVDVYGKLRNYDPQKDASVRVQVSRLRQKLEEYEKAEGKSDPYRLELPKGGFTIVFTPRHVQQGKAAPGASARRVKIGLAMALVLLAGAALWTVLLWHKVRMLESRIMGPASGDLTTLWSAFFTPGARTMVIFGSPAFFASGDHSLFVRMYRSADPGDPRSSPEFRDIDAKLGPLQGPRFDYASMGDAIGVQRLTAFFGSLGLPLRALPAHLAVWDALQDSNLIFLGAWRMNPLLRRLPIQQDFELGSDNFIHNRNPLAGEQAVYGTPSHRDSMSYAVFGAYPGLKPGREIVVLTAHSSSGAVGAVDFVTSAEGARLLRDRLKLTPGDRGHFQVLLRIYADNDTPIKTEYVTHHMAQ